MAEPARAVFLSYASEDQEAAAGICAALRAAGIEVWFDCSELRGGDAWDAAIRRQIRSCALFIPLISATTHARTEGYFRLEWKLAVDRSHLISPDQAFLLPVVIDDTPQTDERTPERFRELQWTRLSAGHATSAFVARVQSLLSPVPTAQRAADTAGTAATAATSRPLPARRRRRPAWLAIAAGVVCVAATALLVYRFWIVPAARPSSQAAVSAAAPPASAPGASSIAVLPFVDMSEQQDQQYFGDGMAEEVLDLLAKLPQLTVIGRTSSFQFKGRDVDLRDIGRRLRVAYVVEGSVRRAGARIRVTAQLIDAASGSHVWSDSYDRDYGDVLTLQDEIAAGIARALQLAVGADEARPTQRLRNSDAYTLYLRGLSNLDRQHAQSLAQAESDFQQALALDPTLLRAAEALALTYVAIGIDENIQPNAAHQQARAAAQRALAIDSRSATAHAVLGFVHAFEEFNWQAAKAEIATALALNPRDPATLYLAAQIAYPLSREEALRQLDASLVLDPLNPYAQQSLGEMLRDAGDLAGSDRAFRRSLEISPTFDGSHLFLAQNLLLRAEPRGALGQAEAETASDARELGLALVNHSLGRRAQSDAALERLMQADATLWPFAIALVHAYRGDADQAFVWLEKAYELRDDEFIFILRSHPMLAQLRGDARYQALLRRMNLPQ